MNIVAEIGCNHMGNEFVARDLIIEAFQAGATHVKGQKRFPRECLSEEKHNELYTSENSFGKTYGEHREYLELDKYFWENEINLFEDKVFTSVFDLQSAREMQEVGAKIFKIGSGQTNNIPLLELVSSFNKRVFLSTGMATVEEIDRAFDIVKNCDPVLFHTTSCYPCSEKNVNLKLLAWLKKKYGCEVGLSGHYMCANGGIEAAAVGLGATWIERHFTLDRTWKGTDQVLSLEPEGLRRVVKAVKSAERALSGKEKKEVFECEKPCRKKFK